MDQDGTTELDFKGGNPGAVQYGNFINYYQFHPPESRIKLLPLHIWPQSNSFCCLDLGSNAGDLTIALYNFLKHYYKECNMIGVDIDPTLIERANDKLKNLKNTNIDFFCLDFMNDNDRNTILKQYLTKRQLQKFDAVFCFSITMWIHLNHGDDGLQTFLHEVTKLANFIVLEPQPWKCYKSAVKRMKLSNASFPLFKDIKIREVEQTINQFLLSDCNVTKIYESAATDWGRKIHIYKCSADT